MAVPENVAALQEFLYAPTTVDFVVRRSEFFDQFIKGNSRVIVTQTLAGMYAVCYATEDDFRAMIAYLGTNFVSSASVVLGPLDRPSLEAAGVIQAQQQPYLDLHGSGVIFGIVDSGIDYTLDVFRYEDGTSKIQAIYDQTIPGNPPEGFYIGTEYTNEQINAALKSSNPYDIVPQRDESGHGTFLASVGAGRAVGEFTGAAPDAEIIAVKVRRPRPFYLNYYSVPADQKDAFESSSVMVGVEFIIQKARQLKRPAVICLGIGTNTGAHDGLSLFEEYLYNISNLKGTCVCTSAGNETQARHHTQGKIPAKGETQNVDIRVGENAGDVFLTIWNNVSDRLAVSIRSPTGELVGRVPPRPGTSLETRLVLEDASVLVEYYFPLETSGGQLTVVKIINATPGIWTVIVEGDIILDGTFHSWLPITGFVSPTVEFLSATPYYTVTIPSTMYGSINSGAYNAEQDSLYVRSSWGPSRAEIIMPDLVSPGVGVGGYSPSGYTIMDGTSVAAAITAGACALMLEWGIVRGNDPSLSTYQIRAYLIRGCSRSESINYPNNQWGYGSLNLIQAFQMMREI